MDFELPEPIRVESKIGDRLILVRPDGDSHQFVTIDFERRRWQLGSHPHRILNVTSALYKSRNWQMRLVADAIRGLLAGHQGGFQEEVLPFMDEEEFLPNEVPGQELKDATEPSPEPAISTAPVLAPAPSTTSPGTALTYAWKRLEDGQISQGINAPTPEALFQQAGFHPHRVLDPIQGFQCVPVEWRDGRWREA